MFAELRAALAELEPEALRLRCVDYAERLREALAADAPATEGGTRYLLELRLEGALLATEVRRRSAQRAQRDGGTGTHESRAPASPPD